MSLWGNLKRFITGYDELPETAVGLDGTVTTPNRYKAQLEAQQQGLPTNVVNSMAQGKNSGNATADNLMKKYNAYEQPQVVHHNGLADSILGTPNRSVVAYDDKGQPLYSETERKGGLINDFTEGFRDNFNNRLSAGNLADNTMADGRQKNLINRIGEGFGTVGRILESPMGRGLITAGLVNSLGGNGLQSLAFGASSGMLNQQNRMKDRIYRRSLIEQSQRTVMNSDEYKNAKDDKDENGNIIVSAQEKRQQMLDDAERQVNSYRGYIGDDTYKQVLTGMQLRDNAEYRNALLADRDKNLRAEMLMKRADLDYKRNRDAKEDYYEQQKLAQGWERIKQDRKRNGNSYQKFKTAMTDKENALKQIKEIKNLVTTNPNATGYIVGKLAKGQEFEQKIANEFLSSNPEYIKTRSAIAKLRGTTMHDLAGTAQTLQEMRNLAPFLPDATDNQKTILAKLEQLENELNREHQGLLNIGYDMGYDYEQPMETKQTTTDDGWEI